MKRSIASQTTGGSSLARSEIAGAHGITPGIFRGNGEKLLRSATKAIDRLALAADGLLVLIDGLTQDSIRGENTITAASVRVRFVKEGRAQEYRLSDIIASSGIPTPFQIMGDFRDERRVYMRVHKDVRADLNTLLRTVEGIAKARKRQAEGRAE